MEVLQPLMLPIWVEFLGLTFKFKNLFTTTRHLHMYSSLSLIKYSWNYIRSAYMSCIIYPEKLETFIERCCKILSKHLILILLKPTHAH